MSMKRPLAAVLLSALLLSLAGCSGDTAKVTVWRRGEDSTVTQETRKLQSGTELIAGAVAAFNSRPEEPGLSRAAPDGAEILGWRLEGSELKLEVSPEWAELSGFDRTLASCCAALTFCGLGSVDRVSFYLLGQRLGPALDKDDILLTSYTEQE